MDDNTFEVVLCDFAFLNGFQKTIIGCSVSFGGRTSDSLLVGLGVKVGNKSCVRSDEAECTRILASCVDHGTFGEGAGLLLSSRAPKRVDV